MLDFIQFINTNATGLTAEQKTALLGDFCEQYSYQDQVQNPENPTELIDNPVSKKEFANQKINAFIKESVNAIRKKRAEIAASYEDLEL